MHNRIVDLILKIVNPVFYRHIFILIHVCLVRSSQSFNSLPPTTRIMYTHRWLYLMLQISIILCEFSITTSSTLPSSMRISCLSFLASSIFISTSLILVPTYFSNCPKLSLSFCNDAYHDLDSCDRSDFTYLSSIRVLFNCLKQIYCFFCNYYRLFRYIFYSQRFYSRSFMFYFYFRANCFYSQNNWSFTLHQQFFKSYFNWNITKMLPIISCFLDARLSIQIISVLFTIPFFITLLSRFMSKRYLLLT